VSVRFTIATARGRPAALAAIDLLADSGAELDSVLRALTGAAPTVGAMPLRPLGGLDRGVVARVGACRAVVMPHGGPAVIGLLATKLGAIGAEPRETLAPLDAYPEAESAVHALVLDALARAASPLAVGLLLSQPARWAGAAPRAPTDRDRRLCRLIEPPLVAVVGPANVGKSTLLNAVSGSDLAQTHDEPGTTRDHVGALVELAGLVVRWTDTPGFRAAAGAEAKALELALPVIRSADLVVLVGDSRSGDPRRVADVQPGNQPGLVIAARADLGIPGWGHDLAVSALTGEGVVGLVGAIRDRLVPPGDLRSFEPWMFWVA
jgi:small GTP-binding protein